MDPITTLLTDAEEQVIVDLIISAQRRALPVTKDTIMSLVSSLLSDERNLMEINQGGSYIFGRSGTSIPDETWYQLFLKRHPNIATGMRQHLRASKRNVNQQDVKQWFADVRSYLAENDFLDILYEAKRNFNIHESEFEFFTKESKILSENGSKTDNELEKISVLASIGADGSLPPPLIIYPNLRIPIAVYDSLPSKIAAIGKSESGQINNEVLYEYLCNGFDEWLTSNNIQRPVIVWFNRHESRMQYHLVKRLSELQIIIILIPPNTSHFMQPIDVGILTPMKKAWVKCVNDFRALNPNECVNKENFAHIFLPMYVSIMSKEKIKNAFNKCGIHPYDVEAPDYSRLRLVTEDSRNVANFEEIKPEGLVGRGKQITPVPKQYAATQIQSSQSSKNNIYSSIRGDSMFTLGVQIQIKTQNNLKIERNQDQSEVIDPSPEIDVDVGLSDPSIKIEVDDLPDLKYDDDLPDQKGELVDKEPYYPSPEIDEDDLPLSVLFSKQSFSLKDDSTKGRDTDLGPNANLVGLWNHSILNNEELAAEKHRFLHMSRELNPWKVPKLNQIRNHGSKKKKNLPNKCLFCDYSCRFKLELSKHVKLNHKTLSSVHQCNSCDFKCRKKHKLNFHIKTFHMQPNICPYCDFECVIKNKLQIHINKVHPKSISCLYCDFACKTKAKLNQHVIRYHKNVNSFKCKYCDYASVLYSNLLYHEKVVHKKYNSYKCPACIHVARTNEGLIRHTKLNHKKQAPIKAVKQVQIEVVKQEPIEICMPSGTNQDQMSGLNQEIKIDTEFFGETEDTELLESSRPNQVPKLNQTRNHGSQKQEYLPNKCDYCDYSCHFKLELFKHIKLNHKTLSSVHQCSSCDFKCRKKHKLNFHTKTFHMHPNNCPFCDFECVLKSKLQIHINKAHPKPYSCQYCDFECRFKLDLSKHIKLKHAIHQCSSCAFKCRDKMTLNLHIKTFHVQPNKCPYCDFECVLNTKLQIHINKVHHPNPYSCLHCDFACKAKLKLSRHIKRHHENIKPFKCKHCDYSCGLDTVLLRHESRVHKKHNPFKCPACIFVAYTSQGLLRHKKTNHKEQELIEAVKQEPIEICMPSWTNQTQMPGLNQEIKTDAEFFGVTENSRLLESSRPNQIEFEDINLKEKGLESNMDCANT